MEEEEAELARAAAAVARLTAPDFEGCVVPSSFSGSSNAGVVAQAADSLLSTEESGPAAAKVRMLEEQVEEAREEVHSAPEERRGFKRKAN